jgi:Tfp pilus assembly protein PilF
MKNLLLCFMLVLGGVIFGADDMNDEELSPWEYWRQGFESFERGEQLRSGNKQEEALTEYLKAKRAFLKVKQAKPNWRQDVIMQRVKQCDDKITQLQYSKELSRGRNQSNNTRYNPSSNQSQGQNDFRYNKDQFTFTKQNSAQSTNPTSESRQIKLLKSQLKDYREKLFTALVSLEDYRNKDKRSSNALGEIENLIKEKSNLNRKYQLLLEKYSNLQRKQQMPQAEKYSLNNKLIEEKMRSDLFEQKVKMYQSNIVKLENDIATLKQRNRNDKFSVHKSDSRITGLEDEIKRLTRNVSNHREQAQKVSLELEKMKYINEIEQRNAKRYKTRLATMNEWLNNSDKTKAAAINQKVARENIAITKQLSKLQSQNDTLLRESLTLKNKLSEEHANMTQLKNMLSTSETEKLQLKQRLNKSSDRARRNSGDSTLQNAAITKLRQENRQLREDLNLFGKSYTKRSGTADESTVSQYKMIIDKLNAELANEKASRQQYKVTHKSGQNELMKLEDSNTKLKEANLDLNEENKNLKAFVKDYSAAMKGNEELKKQLNASNATNKGFINLKKEHQELLKRHKTMSDKLKQIERSKSKQIVVPVKAQADSNKLKEEIKRLRQQNSSMATKTAEYIAMITKLEKEQESLAAHVGKSKKNQTKEAQLKKTQDEKTAKLATTIKQLQAKISSTAKNLAKAQKNQNENNNQLTKKSAEVTQLQATIDKIRKTQNKNKKLLAKKGTEVSRLKAVLDKTQNENKTTLAARSTEISRLEAMLSGSRKDTAKYQTQLKQRIKQAVKIKKTAPQQLPGKLSDHQIAFLLQEGVQAEKSNDYEAAAWHYRKIITNIPAHPEANRRLGLISLNQGNYSKATQQLEKALRAAPKDTELLLAFAGALSNSNKNKAALVTVKQAMILAPENSRVYILNGTILQQLKKNNAAEASFRQALKYSPNSAEANLKLAQLLSRDKKSHKEAGEYYRKALKLGAANDRMLDKIFSVKTTSSESEAVTALRQMASQHENKKDYVAAAWCYSQLLALDKNNSKIKLKYATVLLLDEKPDQALPLIKSSLATTKDKLNALLLLGANYLMLNKTAEASKIYKQAMPLLKAAPKYRLPAAIKMINTSIKNKMGNKVGKEFELINKR